MSDYDYVVLVTGSRDWPDSQRGVIEKALRDVLPYDTDAAILLIHGGCATGVDAIADKFWRTLHNVHGPEVWPADWKTYGRSAGPRRNAEMVNRVAELVGQGARGTVLAFPFGRSAGTRGCMRSAQAAGLPLLVHEGQA